MRPQFSRAGGILIGGAGDGRVGLDVANEPWGGGGEARRAGSAGGLARDGWPERLRALVRLRAAEGKAKMEGADARRGERRDEKVCRDGARTIWTE